MEKRYYDWAAKSFVWTPLERHFIQSALGSYYEPSLPFQKDREKHEQLHEILSGYSNNGLPPLPELLNLGRPTFDEAAFNMEAHWSILVDNASAVCVPAGLCSPRSVFPQGCDGSPRSMFSQALTKRQHDQQEAVWELLQTELSYISQIRVIIDVFKSCLLNVQQESLLNEIETERLFSNIDKILESNCKLWQDSLCKVLEDARSHHHPLNPSIMKPSFTREFQKVVDPYTRYCMEQKQCLEYMKARHSDNDLFKIFVVWAEQQKQCNRLKLTDLLVKPMQRLTKYSLLLQAILRKTDDERQRRDLLEMIASVDKYVTSINSQMQQQHELERLEAIMTKIEAYDAVEAPNDECVKIIQEYNTNFNLMAPMSGFHITHTRALLMHSSLRMKESQSRTDVDCFLFTDLILICKSSKRMDKFKIIRPPMRLDRIVVSELRDKGSFLLIYMNEYHIPISAYSFHGDQAAVRVWLEKIREAQTDYGRQKLEDQTQHRLSQAAAVTEEVVYSPLPGTTPLTMEHTPAVSFPRSQSMESTEGRFIPNITPARSPTTENSSPEKSPPPSQRTPAALERTGSCNEFSPASLNMTRVVNQSRHASSSPEFSPSTDRRHKPVKACHSVPNMSGGQLQIVDNDDDDIGDTGLTMDVMSVNAAVGSLSLSQTNLAEPGPVDDDYNSKLNKLNQRRVSRTEKRYYTADSIQELRRTEKDSSIHKRLSWQNENHLEGKLRKKVLSSDSVHSIPSSSGVSSTASLHLNPESDISEETELAHKRDDSQISNPDMRNDLSPSHLASQGHNTKAKSSPDIVLLFNSLTTGEQEQGISSVGLPAVVDGERQGKKLTHAQLLKMKKQLLLNTDVEAS
ncbi:hypothetical protein BaRGS_00021108, partial [Batillaria attramentaria]